MTAEVAILNRQAVVLAADSAVTLEIPGGKVYNTANKLLAISRAEPVAVMVYGDGSFEGIPWETVTKEYRLQLAMRVLDSVEDYAADFIRFLTAFTHAIPDEVQLDRARFMIRLELMTLRTLIDRLLKDSQARTDPITARQVLEVVQSRLETLGSLDSDFGLSKREAKQLLTNAVSDWKARVDEVFDDIPIDDEIRKAVKLVVCASLRSTRSPRSSGLVFAGFGETQMFPAICEYVVDGVVANKVRSRREGGVTVDWEYPAFILPFAQRNMVHTFMDGIHPTYRDDLEAFTDETLKLFTDYVGDQVKDIMSNERYVVFVDQMNDSRSQLINNFLDKLSQKMKQDHWSPIMSVVGSLPKEEMAEMAEALVSLTSLKRRVSPEHETVGGPVDVAVISKGDGLVWIKRKHYFTPDLNHRYFERDRKLWERSGQGDPQ